MLLGTRCYAEEVNVDASANRLDFGTAVLLASTSTIGVDYSSRPLWLRAMKASASAIPAAGTITFSSDMSDGYDTLIISPTITGC